MKEENKTNEDQILDSMLASLRIPEPSAGFSDRILTAAYREGLKLESRTTSLFDDGLVEDMGAYLMDLLRTVFMPRPALAVAFTLIIGFSCGYISALSGSKQYSREASNAIAYDLSRNDIANLVDMEDLLGDIW